MLEYFKKIFLDIFGLLVVFFVALVNYNWPFYIYLGKAPIYKFIWLGLFFILLDIAIEIITKVIKNFRLAAEIMSFSITLKKISKSFQVVPKVNLPNNLKADYVISGSSGVWLISIISGGEKITFNGEDILKGKVVLKGLITKCLEKGFTLAELLKTNLNRDFKVSSVIVFVNKGIDISEMPKIIRNVHITSSRGVLSLIEETDIQLLDEKTVGEIISVLRK